MLAFEIYKPILEIQKKYSLSLDTEETPSNSTHAKDVWQQKIRLRDPRQDISVSIFLTINIAAMKTYEPDVVEYENCSYADLTSKEFAEVIESIFKGNIRREKTIFKKKIKIIIVDDRGKPLYYPRAVS